MPPPLAADPPLMDSAADQVACYDDCERCAPGWRTANYSRIVTNEQADISIRQSLDEAEQNMAEVCATWSKFGDQITDAWHRGSEQYRKTRLCVAEPKIPDGKGFPITAGQNKRQRAATLKEIQGHRQTFLLPCITNENLAKKPMNLILLIKNRIEYSSADLASTDSEQHENAFARGHLESEYNANYVWMMPGPRYGDLVPWNADDAHAGRMMSFPRAKLVFDAQLELSRFLLRVIDGILKKPPPKKGSSKESVKEDEQNTSTKRTLLSGHGLRHPAFSRPPTYDPVSIIDCVRTRYDAAEDEIGQLLSDPEALHQHLSKRQVSGDSSASDRARISYQLNLVYLAISEYNAWRYVKADAEKCFAVLEQPGNVDSRKYDAALVIMEVLLQHLSQAQRKHLSIAVEFCENLNKTNKTVEKHRGAPSDISLYNSDELQYHVTAIQELESGSEPVAWHLRELFKLPQDQLDRLDQRSIDMLSDIAAVDEMLTSLKSLRPRYSMMREVVRQASQAKNEAFNRPRKDSGYVSDTEESRPYDIVHEFLETNIEWDFMFNHHLPGEEAVRMLQTPLEDYLDLPSSTDGVSAEAKREALDYFWSKLREQRAAELQISRVGAAEITQSLGWFDIVSLKCQKLKAEATRQALALAQEAQEAEAIAAAQLKLQELSINTVQPDPKPATKQPAKSEATQPKKKPPKGKKGNKPRPVIPNGVPPVVQPNNVAAAVVQALPKLPPAIEVKKSSLEFFEDLFGNSQDRSNLKWQGFTAAMGDAGWSVTPTYGSRVTFKNVRGAGSILIHSPHPGDLNATLAGRIATRLERRLGWSKATFGEREKG
ncbi:unnamed protein product [Zymoseptoria tritici ST99CH_1A5]|uniref:Uncharacterized protein n=1 Tax=Zymoseptoria tritici ST99CH_1A5 TaxID=1276529 RepID=A0A1Y6L869_ZYMTR|nr:unnamed protein product [Zymoseptoria tritici ST99CH_1A5]